MQEFYKSVSGNLVATAVSDASPSPVGATARSCLGTQMFTALSTSAAASLTVPVGAICADIQADGGVVRLRRDAIAPTSTQGWRLDDGISLTVDSDLTGVRLLAVSGTTTNVQVTYFDRV